MASHAKPSHGRAKLLRLQGKTALIPLIKNQRAERLASRFERASRSPGKRHLGGRAAAMRPAHGAAWASPGGAFPRRGGRPPIQGAAFSHRSRFSLAPQAGEGRGERVRDGANRMGRGMGFGGRAK